MPSVPASVGEVTIRQLLNKNAGIDERTLAYTAKSKYERFAAREVRAVAIHADRPYRADGNQPFFLGGEGNTHFSLLASVADAAGKPYETALRDLVLSPAALDDTHFAYEQQPVVNRAQGYYELDGSLRPAPFTDESYRRGAGGIYATAHDVLAFVRHLDRRRLSGAATGEILAPHVREIPILDEAVATISMDSWADGFSSFVVHAVDRGATLVVMSNHHGATAGYELRDAFYRWIIGAPLPEPRTTPWRHARERWAHGDKDSARALIEAACDLSGAAASYQAALEKAPDRAHRLLPRLARVTGTTLRGNLPAGIQCHRLAERSPPRPAIDSR